MDSPHLSRLLQPPEDSFFLFGPRSTGKSFWLRGHFPQAISFDLLENRTYLELSRDPGRLEARIGNQIPGTWVCLDEVQKIPSLLEEVHRLIEKKHLRFALTGSSARKLKRGGADLLAGRAVTKNLEGFTRKELGSRFDLSKVLAWGTLPLIVFHQEKAADILSAYVHTYIKEEIREEGIVRKAEPFIRFLEVAGLMNGQQLNKENIARDAMIPRSTVDVYFSILQETLLGHILPAFRPQAKVREQTHPKFYWFDAGVARGAAGLLYDPVDSVWLGHSLETFIYHELRVYNEIQARHRPLYFYRSGSGSEIDFVVETRRRTTTNKSGIIGIEVKAASKWRREWETPLRSLAARDQISVEGMLGVYCGQERYHFDGIDILPVNDFLSDLYQGRYF